LDDKDVTPEEVTAAQTEGVEVEALDVEEEEPAAAVADGEGDAAEEPETDDAGAYALSAIKVLLPLLSTDQIANLVATLGE
jgi:hypothetical protein